MGSFTSSLFCFFLYSPKHQSCEDRKMIYASFWHPRKLSAGISGNSSWSYNTDGFCQSKGMVHSFKTASATDFSLFRQKKMLKPHRLPEATPRVLRCPSTFTLEPLCLAWAWSHGQRPSCLCCAPITSTRGCP